MGSFIATFHYQRVSSLGAVGPNNPINTPKETGCWTPQNAEENAAMPCPRTLSRKRKRGRWNRGQNVNVASSQHGHDSASSSDSVDWHDRTLDGLSLRHNLYHRNPCDSAATQSNCKLFCLYMCASSYFGTSWWLWPTWIYLNNHMECQLGSSNVIRMTISWLILISGAWLEKHGEKLETWWNMSHPHRTLLRSSSVHMLEAYSQEP